MKRALAAEELVTDHPADDAEPPSISVPAALALIFGLSSWYLEVFGEAGLGRTMGIACCIAGLFLSAGFGARRLNKREGEEEAQARIVFRSIMAFPLLFLLGLGFFGVLAALGLEHAAPLNVAFAVTILYVCCCMLGLFLCYQFDTRLSLTSVRKFKPRPVFGIIVGFPIFFLIMLAAFPVLYVTGPWPVACIGIALGLWGIGDVAVSRGRRTGVTRCVAAIILAAAALLFI